MFTVEVSRTTCWEAPVWEQTDVEFSSVEEANAWGENWQNAQETVESFDGFHNAATFRVVGVTSQ